MSRKQRIDRQWIETKYALPPAFSDVLVKGAVKLKLEINGYEVLFVLYFSDYLSVGFLDNTYLDFVMALKFEDIYDYMFKVEKPKHEGIGFVEWFEEKGYSQNFQAFLEEHVDPNHLKYSFDRVSAWKLLMTGEGYE